MPEPECYYDIGELHAKVEMLVEEDQNKEKRIRALEDQQTRERAIGGFIGLCLTGLGVFFADPIKALIQKLFH